MKLLKHTSAELKIKLDNYIANDEHYKAVDTYTKQRFEAATELVAHNWPHAYRDTLNAIVRGFECSNTRK